MVLLKKCYICGENLSCFGRQMVCKQGRYKCKVADIHSLAVSLKEDTTIETNNNHIDDY